MTRYLIKSCYSTLTCLLLAFPAITSAAEVDSGEADVEQESEIIFESGDGEATESSDTTDVDEPIDFDSKRPSILGMTVVEEPNGARVVDIGATSPAWDAGVRKDDVILSLHGIKADSFQEWADGVRKVVADAVDGQSIPIQILRDGSTLDLSVNIPEQKADDIPRPNDSRQADVNANFDPEQTTVEQPLQPGVPYPAGAGGFGGVPVGIDGFADDGASGDRVPTTAAAQLFPVNNLDTAPSAARAPSRRNAGNAAGVDRNAEIAGAAPGTFPGGAGRAAPAAAQNITTGQIGTAEFSDESNGMLVSVMLGGLPPGTYRIGIGDFHGGITNPGVAGELRDRNDVRQERAVDRLRGRQRTTPPRSGQPPVPPGTPPQDERPNGSPEFAPQQPGGAGQSAPGAGGTPGTGGGGGAAGGAGGVGGGTATSDGGTSQLPASTNRVLAQVTPGVGDQPPTPGQSRNDATGGVPPSGASATGEDRIRPGQAPPREPALGETQQNQPGLGPAGSNVGGGQFGLELGTIRVGPNGGGQLQQRLEGIRVASVVGQSVLVVSMNSAGGVVAGRAGRTNRADHAVDPRQRQTDPRQTTPADGSAGVVAAGVIQITSPGVPNGQAPNGQNPLNARGNPARLPGQTDLNGNLQAPAGTPAAPLDRNRN